MNAITASASTLTNEVDRLLNPSRFYAHPKDVLRDSSLAAAEKRAILSAWASDACAAESRSRFGSPPEIARHVSFDEIMDALQALDEAQQPLPHWKRQWPKLASRPAMEELHEFTQ